MAKFNGSDLKIYIVDGGTDRLITQTTSLDVEYNAELIDITTKDNAGWKENLRGLRSGTGSTEGLVDYQEATGEYNYDQLLAAFVAGAKVKLKFKMAVVSVGSPVIEQDAFITSLSKSAPMEAATTFSVSFEFSGAPTVTPTVS
jgi:TP901-1 family phage major tail protein